MTTNEVFTLVEDRIESIVDYPCEWFEGSVVAAVVQGKIDINSIKIFLGYGREEDFITVGSRARVVPQTLINVRLVISLAQISRKVVFTLNDLQDTLRRGLGPSTDGTSSWYKQTTPTLVQVTVGQPTSVYDELAGVWAGRQIPLNVAFED